MCPAAGNHFLSVLLAKLSIKMSHSRSESKWSGLLKCPAAGNHLCLSY